MLHCYTFQNRTSKKEVKTVFSKHQVSRKWSSSFGQIYTFRFNQPWQVEAPSGKHKYLYQRRDLFWICWNLKNFGRVVFWMMNDSNDPVSHQQKILFHTSWCSIARALLTLQNTTASQPSSLHGNAWSAQKGALGLWKKQQKTSKNNLHMDVSKNRGIPKWMVYNGTPY